MRFLLLVLLAVALPANAANSLRILLTNDDGYDSPGIKALHTALSEAGHDVYRVAPATQQSGASASVSARGVNVTAHGNKVWAVEGRPADAVRFALGYLMYDFPPDLVISGANYGQNTGQDVYISGTVGAAMTAYKLDVPAIAISVEIKLEEADRGFPSTRGAFTGAARLLVRLIDNLDLSDLTEVLNINYPAALPLDIQGVRWADLSDHSILGKRYEKQADGSFRAEFELPHPNARRRDAESLVDGYVTLTFLDGDMTAKTKRNQRYLSQHLLDRHFDIEVERPQRRTETKTQPPAKVTTPIPQPPPEDEANVVLESAPMQQVETLGDQVVSVPIEIEETAEDQNANTIRPIVLDQSTEVVEPEDPEAEVKGKKKPDSWLRRMFDPKSWGR